ncbi:hypothetical protein FRC17_006272 [Serendipita sp. 399]|nr:hypothetical protein FRC17_006272 [Serendipita sp. 399]
MHEIGGKIGRVWSKGNKQVCTNVGELKKALTRSKRALLDVSIYHPISGASNTPEMYRKIFGKPNSDRLQKLYINSQKERLDIYMVQYIGNSYPALTTIEIDALRQWSDVLLPRLLKAASSVRSIRSQIPRDLDVSIFNWRNLQSLDLIRTRETDVLNRICNQLQKLHTLNKTPRDWPNELTPATTFNLLSTINLAVHPSHGLHALHQLSFPSLTQLYLEISGRHHLIAIPSSVWRLPSLAEFSLEARSIFGISRWLPSIDMPRLQRLYLDVHVDNSEHFPPSVHYPNVRFLSIFTSSLPESYFIDVLEASPSASVVTLSYGDAVYPKVKVGNLLTRLLQTGSKMLCPHMTKFSIHGGDMGMIGSRELLEALIRRVVEYRVEQLESFTVAWPGKVFGHDVSQRLREGAVDRLLRKLTTGIISSRGYKRWIPPEGVEQLEE